MSASEDRLWLRAQRYIASEQIDAARITLEALVQRVPDRVGPRMLLASTILHAGQLRAAAEHMAVASRHLPDDAESICMVAQALNRVGEMVAMRDCLQHPEIARSRDGQSLIGLAHANQALGDHLMAMTLMDRAAAVGYDNPDFRYFRALQLQFNGRLDEARLELEACLRMGPTYGRASLTLARMRKQTADSNHLEYIRAQLKSVESGSEDHAAFEFAQFKELEDIGEHAEAFAALQRGNAIMYRRLEHDIGKEHRLVDGLIARFDREFSNRPGKDDFNGPIPIFVVGLPRSGTTLLDRILDNHSQVVSTGERSDFPRQLRWVADRQGGALIDEELLQRLDRIDYAELGRRYLLQTQWRAGDQPYFVDKLPPNFMLIGLIQRALPQARILHMVRDPLDVCFSNYKALFGESYPYSYDIDALAAHYAQYRRLMAHWHEVLPGRILDVVYRDLVSDPERLIPGILAHCGLAYEAECADLRRNKTATDTLSSAQVREPIHTRTLGEWQRYATQLEPLRQRLAALQTESLAA